MPGAGNWRGLPRDNAYTDRHSHRAAAHRDRHGRADHAVLHWPQLPHRHPHGYGNRDPSAHRITDPPTNSHIDAAAVTHRDGNSDRHSSTLHRPSVRRTRCNRHCHAHGPLPEGLPVGLLRPPPLPRWTRAL